MEAINSRTDSPALNLKTLVWVVISKGIENILLVLSRLTSDWKKINFKNWKKWKRNIFQNICLCGKTFPQNYPTHSAALKNRKKRWSPNFLFGQATKLDSRLVNDPVPQESSTETSCSSVFWIFRCFRFIRRELFKIFINKYWHESAKYRSNQYVLL